MTEKPEGRTGMVVLQAESELGAINMVFGAASVGKRVMTSSSSPGISLFQEGLSYISGAELPCLIVNVVRGGPGLGTIQPSQADYFQATKGGGHGDYHLLVLAPASVQEMCDFVPLGFQLAFRYRNPVMILTDGLIGQMMEKVELFDQQPRATEFDQSWVATGKTADRQRNVITSLDLDPAHMEKHNHDLIEKYRKMQAEVRCEEFLTADAEYLLVAYGSSARVCQKTVQLAREKGLKVGLLRPITLYPYPSKVLNDLAGQVKGMLSVEMNAGQMVEDVRLSVNGKVPVEHFGRLGGMVHSPNEVLAALEQKIVNR
jgi:2-oxoglutarate ferredoxin oxidoreductase subunit alpha